MATLVVMTKNIINEVMLMRKNSIGAFPNNKNNINYKNMMMFNDPSDFTVIQHDMNVVYNAINQDEKMLNDFYKYFDVILNDKVELRKIMMVMMRIVEKNLVDINEEQAKWVHNNNNNNNIPLLKIIIDHNTLKPIVSHYLIIDDGAVVSVTHDENYDNIIYLMMIMKMIKQKMMAILNLTNLNDNLSMMKIIHNSNNKKLTNNYNIEINTDNINFSYYCDHNNDEILNIIVSVFLSQKENFDIMQKINGSIMMMIMKNKLQSHIQSFIVTDVDERKMMVMQMIMMMMMITKSSITSQSNTNKSEYAFEKTLNNISSSSGRININKNKFYVAISIDKLMMKNISIKSMTMMMMPMTESTSKLYFSSPFYFFFFFLTPSHHKFFSFSMQLYPLMMMMLMNLKSFANADTDAINNDADDNNSSKKIDKKLSVMMISNDDDDNDEMQLNCQKLLQSYKESEQQSGIVVVSINNIKNSNDNAKLICGGATNHKQDIKQQSVKNIIIFNDDNDVEKNVDDDIIGGDTHNVVVDGEEAVVDLDSMKQKHAANDDDDDDDNNYDRMNINELLFSHINDKNETLIDNTVNITCDFNYLNYKINNDKINDQNDRKDSVNVKDSSTTLCNNNNNDNNNCNNNINNNDDDYDNINYIDDIAPYKHQQHHDYTKIDVLIECQRREKALMNDNKRHRMRLCGGGGDSLSGAGASGWGSPPSNPAANPNNPNAGNWGASAQQPTPQQNWNQAAQQAPGGNPSASQQQSQNPQQNAPGASQGGVGGAQGQKPLTPSGVVGWGNPNQPPQQNPNPAQQQQQQNPQQVPQVVGGGATSGVAAKNQLEQLNSMREALFSQDGWSCQNVNQDTNWDVPGSPEPGPRGDTGAAAGVTQWKSHNINNGTELWEANLRNGGQPPPQPVQKTPWNHTPSTNIGGTWGEEDDDANENTSVWAANQNTQQPAPGWNQPAANAGANATNVNVWPAAQGVGSVNANIPKKDDWSSNVAGANSNWDPRNAPNSAGGPMNVRSNMDLLDPRPAGGDMRMMEARDQMQGNVRGVTGRLSGPDMWQQHGGMQGGMQGMNKIVGPNAAAGVNANNSQWPGSQVGGPKDIDMNVKPGGWENSPPSSRRPIGGSNFDDGTSLWGQNRVPGGVPGGGDASWKGVQDPMGRNNFNRNPIGPSAPTGIPPNRLPGASIKPEGNAWVGGPLGHPGGNRNTWDEGHNQNWDDKSHIGSGIGASWNNEVPNASGGPIWNKNNKPSWPDNDITNDWPQQNKLSNTSSEIIRSSKQFRILIESGFKKDDAELALRNTNMNLEEAMDLLQQQQRNAGIEPWHQPNQGFDHSPFPGGNRYPGPQMPFPPNNQKLPNAGPGANMGLNNMPMPFNKHLPHQQQQQQQPGAQTPFSQSAAAAAASQGGQPSAHHLRNLVQQIQKAVQAGYLNHQILNQPLAPQTLQLLNSLLNAIQQLQITQQSIQRNGGVNNNILKMTIQNQKQQISALQTQISQQQALYIKSQGGGGGGSALGSAEFIRQNSASMGGGGGMGNHNNDPIASLENNLSNLGLKQDASPYTSNTTSQQSRLNQWKLPSAIDNKATDPDFSRAPGTTSSKQSLPPTTPTSISSIGIHNDQSTWSSGRNDGSGGWPDSNIDSENKDWPSSNQSPAFTDLVPEFQPGKPWKGTQKNIEDDPSITPGSVARNPLSISSVSKESELFGSNTAKTSPNEILSSSTWSFNPSSTATQQNFNSTMSKLGTDTKTNSWSDSTSELWAAPTGLGVGKTGPPPGLGASKNGSNAAAVTSSESNDWMNWNSTNSGNNSNGTWYSTWLLLKNLTAQIDGSTLRTLCVQHGPLQHFHLYLNHGIALCKYNSREEANKAQQALNNCVLSNTTICAESPSESEVQNILSHLGVPAGGNGGNGNGNSTAVAAGPNASTWRPPSQQSGPRAAGSDSATWGSDWPSSNSAINW